MRFHVLRILLLATALLGSLHTAWAFHTIPCSDNTIQGAIDSILAEEKNNGGADGVDFYIALGGGLVFNEPVVINDNGTPGGVVVAILGGLAIDPTDPNNCAASPGVFDGSQTAMSGGGRFHQSVIQVTGHATVYLDGLILTGASLSGSGGGVSFDGTGSLNLYGVDITNNTAGSGAGIHANGSPPGLGINFHDLVIPNGTHIINFVQGNTASSGPGGGMDLSGETFLAANDGELIVGSNIASGDGGGIAFRGRGSIQLGQNAQLVGNSANNGGGIFVNPTDPTEVFFLDGVIVAGNTAENAGGGVYVGNSTNLHADATAAPTQVFANSVAGSSGCGAGIFVGGPAQMTFSGLVTANDSAGDGGGICGKSGTGDGQDVAIVLAGASPQAPATVANNSAVGRGGGIYCRAYNAADIFNVYVSGCSVSASLFAIDGNSSADGAAIFGETDSESLVSFPSGPTFALNGNCAGRAGCNEIRDNFRSSSSAQGSTIVVEYEGGFSASNVKVQRNSGTHLMDFQGNGPSPTLATMLITDNHADGTLIELPSRLLNVSDATIAHDDIAGTTVIHADDVALKNDILDESVDAVAFANSSTNAHDIVDVLTGPTDATMVPAVGTILHGRAQYVDAANGDYHLAPYSLGIDVGAANPAAPADLDGSQRDFDELSIGNVDGPRDLGAYEFTGVLAPRFCFANDEIFCTQFE